MSSNMSCVVAKKKELFRSKFNTIIIVQRSFFAHDILKELTLHDSPDHLYLRMDINYS